MIESLTIKGFQSHKDTAFTFHPGVNAIIGQTSHGKTAVLRALEWLRLNRPLGTIFLNRSMKFVDVSATIDGHTITRNKTLAGKHKCNLDGSEFSAMGSDVPAPITELFDLGDINVQNQFDGYLLLYDAPGRRAAYINNALRLDRGDTMLVYLRHWARDNEAKRKKAVADAETLQAELDKFPDLDTFEATLKQLEGVEEARHQASTRAESLQGALDVAVDLAVHLADEPGWDDTLIELEALDARVSHSITLGRDIDTRASALSSLLDEIRRIERDRKAIKIPEGFGAKADEYERLQTEAASLICRKIRIDKLLDSADISVAEIEKCNVMLAKDEASLHEAEQELTVCDRCGQALTTEAKAQLLGGGTK